VSQREEIVRKPPGSDHFDEKQHDKKKVIYG
jgi:hypothetical protein